MLKIGSAISKIATPIAGVFGADCYDPVTRDLRPESPCAKARDRLDSARNVREFTNAIYDRFWSKNTKEEKPMQFIVTKQIAVEAETPEKAATAEGETISINVVRRPVIGQSPQPAK